jgi:hypothetical protein
LPPQSRVILVTIHSSPRSSRSCGDSRYRASPADVSSVAVASKLRVMGAEMENMALYLRTSFRLLSSWVHGGGIVELLAAPGFLPLPLPARWGIRCLPRLPAVEGTWIICAPYPLRRWLSLRPPAKSPRARQGFGSQPDAVQASSPQAVAATTGSGRFAAAPRRRVTPDVLTRLVRTARGSAPRVSRTITSEYRSSEDQTSSSSRFQTS